MKILCDVLFFTSLGVLMVAVVVAIVVGVMIMFSNGMVKKSQSYWWF